MREVKHQIGAKILLSCSCQANVLVEQEDGLRRRGKREEDEWFQKWGRGFEEQREGGGDCDRTGLFILATSVATPRDSSCQFTHM